MYKEWDGRRSANPYPGYPYVYIHIYSTCGYSGRWA